MGVGKRGETRQRAIKIAEAKSIQTYAGTEPPKAGSRMALIFYCYYPVYPMFTHTHKHTNRSAHRRGGAHVRLCDGVRISCGSQMRVVPRFLPSHCYFTIHFPNGYG